MSKVPLLSTGSHATNLNTPRDIFVYCLMLLYKIDEKLCLKLRAKGPVATAEQTEHATTAQLTKGTRLLLKELNKHVPPFTYFGHHQTDDSHLGVWIDLGQLHQAEETGKLAQVSSNDWRGIKSTYVLRINDAGLTLYLRKGRKEVWSIR
jgi:hypothetical protein